MYLFGHAAVGMTLAAGTNDPSLAFGIGWLSHYLADFFPHGDEAVGEWTRKGSEVKRLLIVLAPDALLVLAAFAWFTSHRGFSVAAAAAAIGSLVPDVLWGLEKVFKRKLFWRHDAFHGKNHNFFHVRMPLWFGLILQASVAGLLWWRLTLG